MPIDWKQIAEQTKWGVAIVNIDSLAVEFMNPAFARIHGYAEAELIGRSLLHVVAPEARPALARHIERSLQSDHCHFESLHRCRDGRDVPVLIDIVLTTIESSDGSTPRRIVTVQDISGRKSRAGAPQQEQAEFRTKEKVLRSLYECAPVATAVCALNGRYISVNRAMCEMLGYSEGELLTMTFVDISHPDDVERNIVLRRQLLASRDSRVEMEKRYIHKAGRIVWAHMAISLVTDSDDEPLCTIGQMINIDREKLMEQQLAAARQQRDTLVREVHHRIKNNLQSVTGLLLRQKLANPAVGSMLSGAIQQVETIAIVHGLQSTEQRGHLKLCDMLAGIVAATNALNADACAVVLCNELRSPLLIANDETVPLALVLNELITNAVKHSDVGQASAATVTMHRLDADSAVVTIVNPRSALSVAFDFEQGDGVGMGLKLVRSLLPPSGGRIQYTQDATSITAQLWLSPPVVHRADVDTPPNSLKSESL